MYLDPKAIYKVIPIHAAQDENGDYWRSIDMSEATILSYLLIDMKGDQYTCADRNRLEQLGFLPDEKEKISMGFHSIKQKDREDIITELPSEKND
jgi:hypothetical protein